MQIVKNQSSAHRVFSALCTVLCLPTPNWCSKEHRNEICTICPNQSLGRWLLLKTTELYPMLEKNFPAMSCPFVPFHAITQDPIIVFSLICRTFSSAPKFPHTPLHPITSLHPHCTATYLSSVPMIVPFLECHIIENIQYTVVCQASFGWHNAFEIHLWCCMYQQSIHFECP